jgi:hypothetical protein
MSKARPFWNWMGLIALTALGVILIRNPKIVSDFFNGYSKLLGTAIGGK